MQLPRDINGKLANWTRCAGATDPRFYLPDSEPLEDGRCAICGLLYHSGSPEDRAFHRRRHARVMAILDPKPNPNLRKRLSEVDNPTTVDASSPLWMHREMYERAKRFNRESNYYGIMWNENGERGRDVRGELLIDADTCTIVGAASFRQRTDHKTTYWALQWIWITPLKRRAGILKKQFPIFDAKYGAFKIEGPLSAAMLNFVDKLDLRARVYGPIGTSH